MDTSFIDVENPLGIIADSAFGPILELYFACLSPFQSFGQEIGCCAFVMAAT